MYASMSGFDSDPMLVNNGAPQGLAHYIFNDLPTYYNSSYTLLTWKYTTEAYPLL